MFGQFHRNLYTLLLAGGLIGLLSLVIGDVRLLPSRETLTVASPAAPGMQALTTGSTMDGFAAWSPDGRQVAFMRSGRLWLMAPDGGGLKQVTKVPGVWDSVMAWHPDGKRLAFVRLSVEDETARVMLIDLASGKEQELAVSNSPVGHLAWAPSGKSLYYATSRQIRQVTLSGKGAELLSVPGDWDLLAGGMAISPDGKRLVYGAGPQTGRGVQYDLWSVALTGKGEPEQLTREGGIMPSYDRTGKRLVYRNPRQKTGIYLMDMTKHQTGRILPDEPKALYFHPAFSPDGRSLLLSRLVLDGGGGQGGSRFISHIWLHRLGD